MNMKKSSLLKLRAGMNQKKLGSLSATFTAEFISTAFMNSVSRMLYSYIQDCEEFNYDEVIKKFKELLAVKVDDYKLDEDKLFEFDMRICENFCVSTTDDMPENEDD
ncbi:MAG: hypothetical protein FWE52_00630 [Alphaproteobacteria bacterium]|nr:hypothetical protein [Alphaproteobacteria bacterium]